MWCHFHKISMDRTQHNHLLQTLWLERIIPYAHFNVYLKTINSQYPRETFLELVVSITASNCTLKDISRIAYTRLWIQYSIQNCVRNQSSTGNIHQAASPTLLQNCLCIERSLQESCSNTPNQLLLQCHSFRKAVLRNSVRLLLSISSSCLYIKSIDDVLRLECEFWASSGWR